MEEGQRMAEKAKAASVMGWIGVEPQGNITPPAMAQTSAWSLVTGEFVEPFTKEDRQMNAAISVCQFRLEIPLLAHVHPGPTFQIDGCAGGRGSAAQYRDELVAQAVLIQLGTDDLAFVAHAALSFVSLVLEFFGQDEQHPLGFGYRIFHEMQKIVAGFAVVLVDDDIHTGINQPVSQCFHPSFVRVGIPRIGNEDFRHDAIQDALDNKLPLCQQDYEWSKIRQYSIMVQIAVEMPVRACG